MTITFRPWLTAAVFVGMASIQLGIVTPVSNAQEMHPGPRATCGICRARAAAALKQRISAQGKDPRTISREDLETYIREVRASGRFDPELSLTVPSMRTYGLGVSPIKPVVPDYRQQDRQLIGTLNERGKDIFLIVDLEAAATSRGIRQYKVYAGNDEPIYTGGNIQALAKTLHQQTSELQLASLYVIPRGLTAANRTALTSSLRIQMKQLNPKMSVLEIGTIRSKALSEKALLSATGRISPTSITDPVVVTSGRFRGFYTATAKIVDTTRSATIKFFARSSEVLASFVSFLRIRLASDVGQLTPLEIIQRTKRDFIKNNGYSERDVRVMYEEELGQTEIANAPLGSGRSSYAD